MSGPFFFGLGPGHLPARADKIARTHGATLVNYTEPSGQKRHWFESPNMGAPYDGETAASVMAALRRAGVV